MAKRSKLFQDSGFVVNGRSEHRLLIAVIVLAIAVRIAAILVLRSHHVPHSTYEHGEIAENLLAGRGFSVKFLGADGPTSQQAPLYPLCVTVAYWLGGNGTPQALLLLMLGQALLGGLLVLGTYDLGRRAAPGHPLAPLVAAAIVAFYPTLIYATTHVQVALLATTLLIWLMAWAYRLAESGKTSDALLTGALLSLLALTDPILALGFVGVVVAVALKYQQRGFSASRLVRLIAAMVVVAGLGVLPWIVRNYQVHGEFVAIKSSFGYAFWQGNCDLSQGTDKVVRPSVERVLQREKASAGLEGMNRTLWAARHEAGYLDDIALTRDDYRLLGSVSEPERSRILFRRALEDLSRRPARYLELCARRLRCFVLFDETNPKTRVLIYRISHLGLTGIALLGLLVAGSGALRRLAPTLVTAGLITLFHALTIVSARFHIPLEPLMAVWGTVGIARLCDRRRSLTSVSVAGKFVRFGAKRRLGVETGQMV